MRFIVILLFAFLTPFLTFAQDVDLKKLRPHYGPEEHYKYGDPQSMFAVGKKFEENGNISEAVEWYRKAAARGYNPAEDRLSLMYENGQIVWKEDEPFPITGAAKHNHDYAAYDVEWTISLELDGKVYKLHRVIGYHVHEPDRCMGCGMAKPDYRAFGLKTDKGEGIIFWAPWFCASCVMNNKLEDYNKNSGKRVPPIPQMGIVDNVADPHEVIVYTSYEAYKTANVRLRLIEVTAKDVRAGTYINTDGPDEFAFYGTIPGIIKTTSDPSVSKANRLENQKWHNINFMFIN